MEFPGLGQQCNIAECKQLDFLPIKCQFCGDNFCGHHFLPQQHQCSGNYDVIKEEICETGGHRYPCEMENCGGGELVPVICHACSRNFCLPHRHQVDHSCPNYHPPENPMANAAAKIQEITSCMDVSATKQEQGCRSDKLAAKVQLMKLKQRSSGDTGLPQEERLYFLVFPPKGTFTTPIPIFLSDHWTIGRAVDAIATMIKVANHNNIVGAEKLILFNTSDGFRLAPADRTLGALVTDQELYNGQSLILEYVNQDTKTLPGFKDYKT